MSYARSPRVVCSSTVGTNGHMGSSFRTQPDGCTLDTPAEMRNHVIAKGAVVPPTGPSVEREIVLPVPAKEAWDLLTDDERLEEWLAPDVDLVPEPGTPLRVREED